MKPAKIGNIESFEARIEALKKRHNAKQLKLAREYEALATKAKVTKKDLESHCCATEEEFREYHSRCATEARERATKFKTSLKYRPRLKYFKNGEKSGFDPMTGLGHSYDWYDLTRVFKGKLVLNTYRYSMQTCRHISDMRGLFEEMGLKYIEVEAPRGLQNLDAAYTHLVNELGRATIAKSHAVKDSSWRNRVIRDYRKQLSTLKSIGYPVSQKKVEATIQTMIEADNQKRAEAKARGARLRAERRALMPKVESTEAISLLQTAAA